MKSRVNYLISITERINISYIKRLKLVGRDTDEAPIFQQLSVCFQAQIRDQGSKRRNIIFF